MKETIHRESHFEEYISRKITELEENGWEVSKNDDGFDPNTALYMPDFVEYMTRTSPEKVDKMKKTFGGNWEKELERNLVKSLEKVGTVLTLRNGFPMAGFQTIDCSGHIPDDPRLAKAKVLYDNNILRVMHQVHYQTAGNKSLDLVFFINGIPVATAEVKTELTQTVQDAIEEYQNERKPIEKGTSRKNYLLMYKRGAVVHFAISEDEIWMNTDLSGDKPKFLPFNRGDDGHAGNPSEPVGSDEYPTAYFWNDICQKDNWIRIFHNFIFEKEEKKEDVTGRMRNVVTQLFPRYHQWDCVTKAIDDVRENGIGQKYLIEHSAGSGKTETISWIAHELIRMRDENGDKLFSSVIVVTDRIGLDTNIKKTIKQLKKTVGLIEMIGGDGEKKKAGAKNKALAQALHEKREIVVVTLQTFPYALDAIAKDSELTGANFAVLIDEAHSSQEGSFSGQMRAALKLATKEKKEEAIKTASDMGEATDEDIINEYFKAKQSAREMPDNVSFFAFTATPKQETKTIFGRPGGKVDEEGKPLPESFHLYTMRQAIEEGYILDVLKGYMPYRTAYKLKANLSKDKYVDQSKALRTIAMWESFHPTNVMSKVEFIVEHFVKNVAQLLDGQAKAMIVTSGRPAVVRYKYAFDAYLKAHPEYDREKVAAHLQFKVPGEPLVAFSDKISGDKCVMDEDEYLKETNPFAIIKRDYDYTEENMNKLGYKSVENAFDEPKNRFLIVANKFQTGFNQPKLCAMYIDKRISNDIEIVQTYSRTNRTFPGKDTIYIIDFVNDPDTVVNAFKKYDKGAEMEKAQNLEIVYDIKGKLDAADIYTPDELEAYKKARFAAITAINENKDTYRKHIYQSVSIPADRWKTQMEAEHIAYMTWLDVRDKAEESGDTETLKKAKTELEDIDARIKVLDAFRKDLKRYCSAYDYISQIVDFEEPDLEVFYGFAKLLYHRLKSTPLEEVDVRSLVLTDYRINPLDVDIDGEGSHSTLKPMGVGGTGKGKKAKSLKKIIDKLNEAFGEDASPVTGARTINAMADIVSGDDASRVQIRNSTNSKEAVISDGRLESIIKMAALSLKNNEFHDFADKVLSDPQTLKPIAEMLYDLIDQGKRFDIPEIKEFAETHEKK